MGFLGRAWDPQRALFSYSSSITERGFVNDFDHPQVMRYTINSLLGLQEAVQAGETVESYPQMLDAFIAKNVTFLDNWADRGLLLVLLTREKERGTDVARLLHEISGSLERDDPKLDLQGLAWMLWGASAAARAGVYGAEEIARKLFSRLHFRYLDRDSLLARHSLQRYRRDLVSFGGTVYYLRALHEYATFTADEYAFTLFDHGVQRVMALQGPQGEWPWMLSVGRASVIDPYPVFSVHQDSMAMLFLLPAYDRGVPGAAGAIARSCRWVHGENELSIDLVKTDPFFISRSIQRVESNPRLRRYLRQFRKHQGWQRAGRDGVEVNPECRSYHIGWILFAWASRQDLLEASLRTTEKVS